MKQNKKAFVVLFMLCTAVLMLSQCSETEVASNDPRGKAFAGSAQCRQCHQSVYDTYIKTAHYNSTRPASKESILGSFAAGKDRFTYNDSTYILMQERDSGFYQTAFVNEKEVASHRFDILFGVKHAQTSLYWNGDRTFELPVSHYTSFNSWGTSPGFSHTNINFKRFIGANCFECHSSYIGSSRIASTAGIEEVLDKNTLIYGIDCERCHGPALNHVKFHLDNPGTKEPKHIVRIASLTREQKLDACAVCHLGNNKMQERSTFQFKPGDTLSHFFVTWQTSDSSTDFDVHGNQYQLLAQSKCFLRSKTMTCSTCHNPHANAGNDVKAYSTMCMNCHQEVSHSFAKSAGSAMQLQNDCVTCHMPSQPSRAITFHLSGSAERSAYLLRTHKIAVYSKGAK